MIGFYRIKEYCQNYGLSKLIIQLSSLQIHLLVKPKSKCIPPGKKGDCGPSETQVCKYFIIFCRKQWIFSFKNPLFSGNL